MTANQSCKCACQEILHAESADACIQFVKQHLPCGAGETDLCANCGHLESCHPPANQEGEKCRHGRVGYCYECKAVQIAPNIAAKMFSTGLEPSTPTAEPEGELLFTLSLHQINDIQLNSLRKTIERAKHAHHSDFYMRINGKDERVECDWLKHLVEVRRPLDGDAIRAELSEDELRPVFEEWFREHRGGKAQFQRAGLELTGYTSVITQQAFQGFLTGFRLATKRGEG